MPDVLTEAKLLATFSGGDPGQIALQNLIHTLFTTVATVPAPVNYKGVLDCSGNPNYPAASAGDIYNASVAGKIGGASGTAVDISDLILCTVTNAGGTQAGVGTSWITLEHNLLGALLSANNLSDVANAGTARTNLGLAIGTNVQAYAANLTTFAAVTPGTGVATALAVNVGSAGAVVTFNGALGTPASGVGTNLTGLPLTTGVTGTLPVANGGTGITAFGTGIATALGINVGSAGAPVLFNGAGGTPSSLTLTNASGTVTNLTLVTPVLGTPQSGTLTNCTLPVGGVTGLAANVATFLATPSSANLAAAITDETGTGAAVFANTPTLVTPVLGAATGTSVTVSSYLKTTPVAVASLPAAATAGMGARAFVNDGSTTLILGLGATVTGGGANKVPVYSDGTNWIYG